MTCGTSLLPNAFGINRGHLNDVAIGSPRCNHLDVTQGTISGHAREHQNRIELAELVADVLVPLVTQNEPS